MVNPTGFWLLIEQGREPCTPVKNWFDSLEKVVFWPLVVIIIILFMNENDYSLGGLYTIKTAKNPSKSCVDHLILICVTPLTNKMIIIMDFTELGSQPDVHFP